MTMQETSSENGMPRSGGAGGAGSLAGAMEYFGNINYCYADAAAMFLAGHGVRGINSGLLEVLTGISLVGAHRLVEPECEKLYFSMVPDPDRLTTALRILGLTCRSESGPPDADPVALLRGELADGPVLVGPLDMGYLHYFPHHQHARGADHYVVVYGMDDTHAYLHDPLGYPATAMRLEELSHAWRGDALPCPGPPYHRWAGVRRVADPSPAEIYAAAAEYFTSIQREVPGGGEVIRSFAEDLRSETLPPRSHAFLTIFSFPAQARRATDYAAFFRDGGDLRLAALKQGQAELFSQCLQAGQLGEWSEVADRLRDVAELDEEVSRHPIVR